MKKDRVQNWKNILAIAWPLIIANSFWNLQLTIDRVFLGQFSTEALGAAMAVMGVFWVPMALLQQTAAYLTTFVAQYFGAKKYEMIGPAVWQSLYVSVIGGLLFLLLIPISPWLFEFLGHSPSMRELETQYFVALCFSALPAAIVAGASGFYTGLGKTQIIIWINFVGLLANAVLDYLFIFGNFGLPAMGIAGAGYATALANVAAAVFGLWLMFSQKHEHNFQLKEQWQINLSLMKRFVRFGLPSGLQWALEGLGFSVFLIIIGQMKDGSAALAASGIATTVMMLAILPPLGIAQAVSMKVGQCLGEKKPELAEEFSWSGFQVSLMYISLAGLSFVLFPQFYLSWFQNSDDLVLWNQVKTIAPVLLLFVGAFVAFDSMNLIFSFTLKGAGDTQFVSIVALLLPWPLMVFPTYLIKDLDGAVYWAWLAASVFIITQAFIFFYRFKTEKWKQMSVIH